MKEIYYDWATFKSAVITIKQLQIQYTETIISGAKYYNIFATETGILHGCNINATDDPTEVTDFETNYKTNANKEIVNATDSAITLNNTLATQIYGWFSPTSEWKKISAAEYPPASGQFWVGVFGEVGTRTKAENPINISVKRTIATLNQVSFIDETVPTGKVWYILEVSVGNQRGAQIDIYTGNNKNKEFVIIGDGVTSVYTIGCNLIEENFGADGGGFLQVWKGIKDAIVFSTAPASGTTVKADFDIHKPVAGELITHFHIENGMTYNIDFFPILSGSVSEVYYVSGSKINLVEGVDYTINYTTGLFTFLIAPPIHSEVKITYKYISSTLQETVGTGNGTTTTFALSKGGVEASSLKGYVNGVLQSGTSRSVGGGAAGTLMVFGTGAGKVYTAENAGKDYAKSDLTFADPTVNGTTYLVKYIETFRKAAFIVAAGTSEGRTFGAPIKLPTGSYIVTVCKNNDTTSGTVVANINGFYEVV